MSASSRTPPSEMRTYSRPMERAIDLATEVLPTPGGPTKRRIGPLGLPLLLGGGGRHDLVLADVSGDLVARSRRSRRLRLGLLGLAGLLLRLPELADGEELEHPVLDVAQGVVVRRRGSRRPRDVQVLGAAGVPRQLGDGLQVGADHLGLHGLAAHAAQAAELAVDLLADLLRQVEAWRASRAARRCRCRPRPRRAPSGSP